CQRRVDLSKFPGTGQNEGGSHVRMTGERDFSARSKNSDVTRVASFCRKHEGALGEVELACDLLHLMIRKALRLGQHGQRIPAEAPLGKNITDVVAIFHESGQLASKAFASEAAPLQISPLDKFIHASVPARLFSPRL